MKRPAWNTLWVALSMCCAVVVAAEAAGLLWLWSRGELSADRLDALRTAWEQPLEPVAGVDEDADTGPSGTAADAVMRERVLRAFDLESREQEIALQTALVVAERDRLLSDRHALEKQQAAFRAELDQITADTADEATEQTRGVLLAMAPADAVTALAALDVERNVVLLQGLPAKSIGKILKEMSRGDDEQKERAARIFEALSRGEPLAGALKDAIDGLSSPEVSPGLAPEVSAEAEP
jgi:flagellar motility protein MotE (MotC chaperone)